jgi:ferrous iron transport protein B
MWMSIKMKKITVALAGNPNVGKTSLFNALTGAKQKVGNWPGVTVEKKTGKRVFEGTEIDFVDLPGTYSLTAYSTDEIIARDYIIDEKPDVVIHVADSTNLERNLYLTTQLMELGSKVVLALNMSDMAEARGDKIDAKRMEEFLEVPTVKTVASEEKGIENLLREVINEANKGPHHEHEIGYGKKVEAEIEKIEKLLAEDDEFLDKYPLRWLSVKLIEGDESALGMIKGSSQEKKIKKLLGALDLEDYEAEIADKRYELINRILPQVCTKCVVKFTPSDMIDRVLTNKYLGIPIFLAVLWAAFELTFTFSGPFMDIIDVFFANLASTVTDALPGVAGSLLGDGIIGGVGFVLVFIPPIFILFWLLAILEDSGYLSRAAFIMDRLLYKMGLHGKSFVPLLMGLGCSVPAVMATRTIEDKKDRMISILVTPFVSCGARLPVYVLLAGAFFGREAGTVVFAMYVLGILVAIFSALLFRKFIFKGDPAPFIMELPPYRKPTLKGSAMHMWERGFMYLKKAGTIIVLGALIVWFLASFPEGVEYGSEASYAGMLGKALEPLFAPLGFDWKIVVALIFGFIAKEIVVGSLGVLYGVGEDEGALTESLQADPTFTPLSSLGLMIFTLVYVPCVATVGVIKQETGSWKWTLFSVFYSTGLAWLLAFIVYNGGKLLGYV